MIPVLDDSLKVEILNVRVSLNLLSKVDLKMN